MMRPTNVFTPKAKALLEKGLPASRLETVGGWAAYMAPEEYAAGKNAKDGGKHYPVWAALKDAGVPVRDGDTLIASLCATAINEGPAIVLSEGTRD